MPAEQQLAKRFTFLRQGWFYFLGLVALSFVRRWLLSRSSERPPLSSSRDRRAPGRERDRRSPQTQPPGGRSFRADSRERAPRRAGNSHHNHTEAESAPVCGAAEVEMGPQWHFEGRRRWLWLHDGSKPNGWVEFGADGILRTSLCTGGRGSWERRSNGEMLITFGKCHHIVFLLDVDDGQPPMFELRERVMKDGSPLRNKRMTGSPTRGRLEMES